MSRVDILDRVSAYYTGKLSEHGPNARGVDWNSEDSQRARFAQLVSVCDFNVPFSLLDYGCGYGALSGYLHERNAEFEYTGFDVSTAMIASAREANCEHENSIFESERDKLRPADFAVASGVFNVKMDVPEGEWIDYIAATLEEISALSTRGFAFNMLTSYSDADRMRPDLFYGDPKFYFDYCVQKFSRWVAVLHDYGLYEFTVLVRKDA